MKDIESFLCNNFRKFSKYINNTFDIKKLKQMYGVVHEIYIYMLAFILMFNCNPVHLIVVLSIITLDGIAIVILHQCPLTMLEKKYLKKSTFEKQKKCLKNLGISYECNHVYESQLEIIINVWLLFALKCIFIILLKTLHIPLINYSNLYV